MSLSTTSHRRPEMPYKCSKKGNSKIRSIIWWPKGLWHCKMLERLQWKQVQLCATVGVQLTALAELASVTGHRLFWNNDIEPYWFSIDLHHLSLALSHTDGNFQTAAYENTSQYASAFAALNKRSLSIGCLYILYMADSSMKAVTVRWRMRVQRINEEIPSLLNIVD